MAHHPNTITAALADQGKYNQSLRVIPVMAHNDLEWQAPWQALFDKKGDASLAQWQKAAIAYIRNDPQSWNDATKTILFLSLQTANDPTLHLRLKTELFYHTFSPNAVSFILYAAVVLLLLTRQRKKYSYASAALMVGAAAHGIGILCRMVILQRPPVSTLYESIVFVGLLTVALGFFLSVKQRSKTLLFMTALAGVVLQLVAFGIADDQDNLKVLQAVLNSRFWLGLHVLTITIGYAFCILTGLLAHVYLAGTSFIRLSPALRDKIQRWCFVLTLWSLLFTATGTLLGGIWADQSWGRFWGWDPKENGALLIVLWLTWLLHGKISQHISSKAMMFGLAALTVMTGLSWMGINLLGIGLHTYGFITGVALGFGVFLGIEVLFFFACWMNSRETIR